MSRIFIKDEKKNIVATFFTPLIVPKGNYTPKEFDDKFYTQRADYASLFFSFVRGLPDDFMITVHVN